MGYIEHKIFYKVEFRVLDWNERERDYLGYYDVNRNFDTKESAIKFYQSELIQISKNDDKEIVTGITIKEIEVTEVKIPLDLIDANDEILFTDPFRLEEEVEEEAIINRLTVDGGE